VENKNKKQIPHISSFHVRSGEFVVFLQHCESVIKATVVPIKVVLVLDK
jgi:hypothetical protein